jgi:hypothetical protein
MSPKQMRRLLNGLATAADVVEAIDSPHKAHSRGWDLSGWTYRLVPWGVRFSYHSEDGLFDAEVLSVLALDGSAPGAARGGEGPADRPLFWPSRRAARGSRGRPA